MSEKPVEQPALPAPLKDEMRTLLKLRLVWLGLGYAIGHTNGDIAGILKALGTTVGF